MAKEIAASTMKLKLVSGQDAKDNPKYSTRSFKDINTELSDEDMLSVGTAMACLWARFFVQIPQSWMPKSQTRHSQSIV